MTLLWPGLERAGGEAAEGGTGGLERAGGEAAEGGTGGLEPPDGEAAMSGNGTAGLTNPRRPSLDDRPAESERQPGRRGSGADPMGGDQPELERQTHGVQGARRQRGAAAPGPADTAAALALAQAASDPQTTEKESNRDGRHLRVVEARARRRLTAQQRARLLVGGVAVLAVVVAFTLVYLHVVLAQRQFELDRLTVRANQSQSRYQQLQLKVAQLSSPQQIISAAEGKLGMRQPKSVTYLSPSPASTTPGSATTQGTNPAGASTTVPQGNTDWAKIKPYLEDSP